MTKYRVHNLQTKTVPHHELQLLLDRLPDNERLISVVGHDVLNFVVVTEVHLPKKDTSWPGITAEHLEGMVEPGELPD